MQLTFLKIYENYSIPNIKFNYSGTIYHKSFVPIISPASNILSSNLLIGEIDTNYTVKSTSSYIIIDDNNNVYLKEGFQINDLTYNLNLWKILLLEKLLIKISMNK